MVTLAMFAAMIGRERIVRPAGKRIGRPILFLFAALRHLPTLYRVWNARPGSLLEVLLATRPEIWNLLRVRFLSARWSVRERFARIIDHCETVERLGMPFDLRPNQNAMLIELGEIGANYSLVLDSPRWLLLDGLLALNIFEGHERIYSVAFILCSEGGELVAYTGGIQGRRGADTLDRYKRFTKAAHGARPADMIVELLRMTCAELSVTRLRCVADRYRHLHGPLVSRRADFADPVTFDYDAFWRERGGREMGDGFFDLEIDPPLRPLAEVAQRKRAERRRRYELMAALRERLAAAVTRPASITVREHEPIGWP